MTVNIPELKKQEHPTVKQIIVKKIVRESGIDIVTPDVLKLYKKMKERGKRDLIALGEK